MEQHGRRRRTRPLIIVGALVVVLLVIAVAVAVPLSQRRATGDFESTFMARCQKFDGADCSKLWGAFQQAYVGRDPCQVTMEMYDPFIAAAASSSNPQCSKWMFWSKTKDIAHNFTAKNKGCYFTVEETLLGALVDDLTWCGKEGSTETFTSGCPEWGQCENSPVHSFWKRASTAFADATCGDTTVMLNGSLDVPFHPDSVFASIEVKRLTSPKVRSLTVVLVTQNNVGTCSNDSLKNLQKELAQGISYTCKEVSDAKIHNCSSSPQTGCQRCW